MIKLVLSRQAPGGLIDVGCPRPAERPNWPVRANEVRPPSCLCRKHTYSSR
jgi:hypothetical protein